MASGWFSCSSVKARKINRNYVLGVVDIYLSETDCEEFFVLTRRGEEE